MKTVSTVAGNFATAFIRVHGTPTGPLQLFQLL